MEASAGVLRRFPSVTGAGAGISNNPFHHSCRFSCFSLKSGMVKKEFGVNLGCGFYDEGYLEYYSSGRGGVIRCGKKKKEKDMVELKKKTKKKMKLIKGLSKSLSNLTELGFGFGSDYVDLVDQVQGKTISEAADLLLGQLQQLKAEEKELKRKRKEEKALMKMKVASQVQSSIRNCEMESSSSSSSDTSESSDDECQNLVDMKSLKIGTLAQTIPEACDRALENATLNPALSTIVEPPQTLNPEADTSVEISSTLSTSTEEITGRTTILEAPVLEQKGECCLEASDCHIGTVGSSITLDSRSNASIAAATTTTVEGTKRIEVCMGGKCKRLGAEALLEEFQRVAGIEAAVSGCKCMGKCKVGPNVRVSGCSSSSSSSSSTVAFQVGDSVAVSSAPPPTTSNSLCIGVGLEDVSLIAANLVGRYQEVGLANALP